MFFLEILSFKIRGLRAGFKQPEKDGEPNEAFDEEK